MTDEECFNLLAEPIQRWIYDNNWTSLREIQRDAIETIMTSNDDVLLSASTAQGKTEAVFLPVISKIYQNGIKNSLVLYISPLTALIDDQFSRLSDMCENIKIPVIPWHGSSSENKKRKFLVEPYGILIITPESLQSLFVNKGNQVGNIFRNLSYIVVDELHSFIGSERGKQLQCLIHLTTLAARKRVPRIGLSATIGDIKLAAEYLSGREARIIESKVKQPMKILQKVIYSKDITYNDLNEVSEEDTNPIVDYLFPRLIDSKNLIFPNSKDNIEYYAQLFAKKCEKAGIENRFKTHYANISRRIKKETEEELKNSIHNINVICTNTLELGIDIGSVKSIVQINPPMTVSSLRQRMGRSGRHEGEYAILRAFTNPSDDFPLIDLRLLKMAAMISLMLEGWCEPPVVNGLHLSTLIQQILSYIRQKEGTKLPILFKVFCESGLFKNISREELQSLLDYLKQKDIIEINQMDFISLGKKGEGITNFFHFYAAFKDDEEMYDLVDHEKKLGEIPKDKSEDQPRQIDDVLLFLGKKWKIIDIDTSKKKIKVVPDPKGELIYYASEPGDMHDIVAKRIYEICTTDIELKFLDNTCQDVIEVCREEIKDAVFYKNIFYDHEKENYSYIITWKGTAINRTLKIICSDILKIELNFISIIDIGIRFPKIDDNSKDFLLKELQECTSIHFSEIIGNLDRELMIFEKWDYLLPDDLLRKNFESMYLDFPGLQLYLKKVGESNG